MPQEAIEARPGEKATFRVEVISHLRWDFTSTIEVASGSPPSQLLVQRKVLLKRGRASDIPFTVLVPDQEEVSELTITVGTGSVPYKKKVWLQTTTAAETAHGLYDLVPEPVWGYCFRRGKEVSADGSSGATFYFGENSCGGIKREGYFAHPPYIGGVGYTFGRFDVELPEQPAVLKFSIGLRDGSTSQDGVVFRIIADAPGRKGKVVFDKHWQKTEWSDEAVDLSAFAGLRTTLKLITDVGQGDNSNSDWACWGDPRIVLTGKRMKVDLRSGARE